MADFRGTVPTREGLELLGLLGTGTVTLNFTRVAVGSGLWTPEQVAAPAEMIGLVCEEMTLAISPESVKPVTIPEGDAPAGCYAISVMLTNAGLENGFALREIGLFATHPQRGEILFAVDYAGNLSDYIPALPANASPLEKQFNLNILTGTAREIFVNQAPVLLATHTDIVDHNSDPEAHEELFKRQATGTTAIISPADGAMNIGETPIFIFGEFIPTLAGTSEQAIQFQTDIIGGDFTSPIHDSGWLTTIASGYELPSGIYEPGSSYKSRVRRRLNNGLISEWSEVPTLTTRDIFNYTDRSVNIEPVADATNVGECPIFKCAPFAVVGDTVDTHVATECRIRQGDTVIHLSPELGAVLEYKLSAGLHLVSNDYVYEFRHKGALFGWGEWAVATPYRTAAAFITGDEAVYPSSWVGHDNASAAGVALADDAALRSNGVDQDEGEGDWVEYSVRVKVRDEGINILNDTSPTEIVTTKRVPVNTRLVTGLGSATVETVTQPPANVSGYFEEYLLPPDVSLGAISFNSNNEVWGLNSTNIFRIINNVAIPIPNANIPCGSMRDITVAEDGTVWVICNTATSGCYLAKKTQDSDVFVMVPTTGASLNSSTSIDICSDGTFVVGSGLLQKILLINPISFVVTQAVGTIPLGTGYTIGHVSASNYGILVIGATQARSSWLSKDMGKTWVFLGNTYVMAKGTITNEGMFYIYNKRMDLAKGETVFTEILPQPIYIRAATSSRIYASTTYNGYPLYVSEPPYHLGIPSANFASAPTRAHILPALTAATGPAGTSFLAADFSEIPIETATLGTDSDPDRPDFILLESVKQTLSELFRRIACGVSGLFKDTEVRVPEAQINMWKQG